MTHTEIDFNIQTIGVIQSPFIDKFGIPRQPGLATAVKSSIILNKEFSNPDMIDSLEQSSHIWIIFIFSACINKGWNTKVRPPRLGGNKKIGVFASRSPFRPNPIGMSAVKLLSIESTQKSMVINVLGADLMHGTPVVDIKPYIPYSDKIDNATNALAENFIPLDQPIYFSSKAQKSCEQHIITTQESLSTLIEQVLRCDPRPAYQKDTKREYGITLYNYNVLWTIQPDRIDVIDIQSL